MFDHDGSFEFAQAQNVHCRIYLDGQPTIMLVMLAVALLNNRKGVGHFALGRADNRARKTIELLRTFVSGTYSKSGRYSEINNL